MKQRKLSHAYKAAEAEVITRGNNGGMLPKKKKRRGLKDSVDRLIQAFDKQKEKWKLTPESEKLLSKAKEIRKKYRRGTELRDKAAKELDESLNELIVSNLAAKSERFRRGLDAIR